MARANPKARKRAAAERTAERTCIATGETAAQDALIRFALGPDGVIVPDLGRKLPGRGVYVRARADDIRRAAEKGLFARAFGADARLPEGVDSAAFVGDVAAGLRRRLASAAGLARRAGDIVVGIDAMEKAKSLGFVFIAGDAAARSRAAAERIAARHGAPASQALSAERLAAALGLDGVRFAGVKPGRSAARAACEAARLVGFDFDGEKSPAPEAAPLAEDGRSGG